MTRPMMRRIVELRDTDELKTAWTSKSLEPARKTLSILTRGNGVFLERSRPPVRHIGRISAYQSAHPTVRAPKEPDRYCVVAHFDHDEAVARFKYDHRKSIHGVYGDPRVSALHGAGYCSMTSVGSVGDVIARMQGAELQARNLTGVGTRVAIVDSGIDTNQIAVAQRWSPTQNPLPPVDDHGTQRAADVKLLAPGASLLDYAVLGTEEPLTAFLSDILAAYDHLMQTMLSTPGVPLVVTNSWAILDRNEDRAASAEGAYTGNADHPFNRSVGALVAAGADVLFAAGNCGIDCPLEGCGVDDVGPGNSIHGANSHPDVLTVAAVTVHGQRLGYSSQGPGVLASRKPDVSCYAQFAMDDGTVHTGTSTACPVLAGAIAAIRQSVSPRSSDPYTLKAALLKSANNPRGGAWNADLGYGIVCPDIALTLLGQGH